MTKIADLSPSQGNFHSYNHKMGINFYTLLLNADYTLCIEILNTDYQLYHKAQLSVNRATSQGLTIGNVSVKKFSHRYLGSKNQPEFMYYHRMMINFKKATAAHPYFLHLLVDIPQVGSDLRVYPKNWTKNYVIAYGILGQVPDVYADKVYDYHTAFDIKPAEVSFNVDINANQKKILNVALDKNVDNSAATVKMVKDILTFTKNNLYREFFEEFYDFSDARNYKITKGVSGVTFTGLNPNITFPTKDLSIITTDGIRVKNDPLINLTIPHSPYFTICLVMQLWLNRNFTLRFQVQGSVYNTRFSFNQSTNKLYLYKKTGSTHIDLTNSFYG